MNILIIVLSTIAAIIALFLIIALFIKKDYAIDREILINKPSQEVFNYIKYLKNQDDFSKWALMDPQMKKEYKGTDATVGFVASWESLNKKVGKGEQEIKKITDGKSVEYEIRFIKPFEGKANASLVLTGVGNDQTKVTWGFSSGLKYPMNIMLLFLNIPEMLGKDLSTGLTNLKNLLER